MEIPKPGLVDSFGASILNMNQLSNTVGFAIYYSFDGQSFEFLGVLHSDYPTAIFKCPWSNNPNFKAITGCDKIMIGFELKTRDFLKSIHDKSEKDQLQKNNMILAIKTEFAMKVAENLYNFLSSYVKTTNDGQMIVAPQKCLDQWHDRFKQKYILDPHFFSNKK